VTDDRWTADHFDAKYSDPDPWDVETSPYEQRRLARQVRVLDEHSTADAGPGSILELGCGEGVHTAALREAFPGSEVVGVDISTVAIRRARERLSDDPDVTFVVADLTAYVPTLDRQFDAVVWSDTITYQGGQLTVAELDQLVEAVCGCVADGGLVCLANAVDRSESPDWVLNTPSILDAYRAMLSARLRPIHGAEYQLLVIRFLYSAESMYFSRPIRPKSGVASVVC
jgi:SAM-dependent methyltransferase